jgi:Icc-related predicted phosphoesterase
MLTHGPPLGILDQVGDPSCGDDREPENVGCEHLLKALRRARPRLHVFGHIHESRGAAIVNWGTEGQKTLERLQDGEEKEKGYAYLDLTRLERGRQTAAVNACLMNLAYQPVHRPWLVDLELPVEEK